MEDNNSRLTNAEFKLMKVFWQFSVPVTTNDIMKTLPEGNEWKVTTVLTLISKLVQKDFINAKKSGRSYTYNILINEQTYVERETKSFFKMMHSNSLKSFIAALYDCGTVSKQELDEIEQWFKQK